MTILTQLPTPAHFDPARVGEVWRVPYQERAVEAIAWAKRHNLPPAQVDGMRICLLAIDVQNTFCIPDFELFVGGRSGTGAVEDTVRLCQFIYRNLEQITEIVATMDTHTATQIFHSVFWVDAAGNHPSAMTMISVEDVKSGKWRANPAIAPHLSIKDVDQLQAYALHYVQQLQSAGKYLLTIWPYHSMLGGIGHALVPAFEEACFFHAIARQRQTRIEMKGSNPLTENYSVLRPEVMIDPSSRAIAQKNQSLIETLLTFDAVVVAGQAKSHCVAWTVADLLSEIKAIDPSLAQKVYLLEDCSSPVVVPGVIDFTDSADETYQMFADAGMNRICSTDPMESWLRL
ncbi:MULTISPECIES: isochorismatase [unclassified Leptolyngbya]|uniref:isochorismatase n=1 Tax=unclassified Leptolyngbya TaxID=2650499 RepID=UPI00168947F4|nr:MULTISPECIES: isochorismatase [unclassified Leptolyngbya]MBD1910395.1 isochorismatase [Leptolyngbya sp. FACHB-8]MBD2157791.1 isochorismatase [Leptolyngbya sp. FACHB-16]